MTTPETRRDHGGRTVVAAWWLCQTCGRLIAPGMAHGHRTHGGARP